jgi:hypothetical protein
MVRSTKSNYKELLAIVAKTPFSPLSVAELYLLDSRLSKIWKLVVLKKL